MPSPTARTHDGRRVLLHLGLVVALLAAPLSGLLSAWYFTFTLFGERPEPHEYRAAAISVLLVAAALALLATFVLAVLRPQPWVHLLAGLGVLALLLLAADLRESARTAGPYREPAGTAVDPWTVAEAVGSAAVVPTSWPLLAFAVGAVVVRLRARSSRAPRAPRVPSSAPGRRPST